MRAEWRELDGRIAALNAEFAELVRADPQAGRLVTIPGVGVLGATAIVAAVGSGDAFRRVRDLAAWLGLVPRQMTTGGRPKLLGITKRGKQILAHAVHPWGSRGTARAGEDRDADRRLAARSAGPSAPQCCGCRLGRQAGPNCLGNVAPWRALRAWAQDSDRIDGSLPALLFKRRGEGGLRKEEDG